MSNTTGVTSGVESAYPSGEPKILVWVRFSHLYFLVGTKQK